MHRFLFFIFLVFISIRAEAECLKTYTQEEFEKVKNYDEYFICNFHKYGSFVHMLAGNIYAINDLLNNCAQYQNTSHYFVTKLKRPTNCQNVHVAELTPGNRINLTANKKDCLKAAKYLTENLIGQKFNTVVFSENLAVCSARELKAHSYCCD